MKTQCPNCGSFQEMPPGFEGGQLECRTCHNPFTVEKPKPDYKNKLGQIQPTNNKTAKKATYAGYTLQVFGILITLWNILNFVAIVNGAPVESEYTAAFTSLFVFLGLLIYAIGNLICWLGRIYLILNDKQKK